MGCKDSESDKGDRIESLFNISFWAKERDIDWKWIGLDTPGKERTADELISCLLDSPWPCATAVLRTLQMCEPNDSSVLQMPSTCP